MKVVELHPEELLERAEHGELSESDRERLEIHLAKCAVCRFERSARADFAAEMEAEERPSRVGLLVAGAMRVSVAPPAPSKPPRRNVSVARRTAVLLVAAAVTMAGAAGANGWVGQALHDVIASPSATANEPQASAPAPAPRVHTQAVATNVTSATSEPAPVESAPVEGAAAESAAPPRVVKAPAVMREGPSAADLFDDANDARRRGDHKTALVRYRELQARSPRSEEAKTSLVTVGRLELDEGDLQGALSEFEGYLRDGGGELREEAMAGRALALERLGRGAVEAEAWRALMAAYPGSSYAVHASARLATLGPR